MIRLHRAQAWTSLTLSLIVCLFAYTNCSPMTGKKGVSSESPLTAKAQCLETLIATYQQTYHPFLKQNCAACHGTTHGSEDATVSYEAFANYNKRSVATVSLIEYQATHSHGGNSLGPQMQSEIDVFKPTWNQALETYESCNADSGEPIDEDPTLNIVLLSKTIPDLESTRNQANRWVPVSWNVALDVESATQAGKLKATFKVEARYLMSNMMTMGLMFRNPQIQLDDGQEPVHITALSVIIDGQEMNQVTTYSNIGKNVMDTTNLMLAPASGSAVAQKASVTGTSLVSFAILDIKDPIEVPVPEPSPTPNPLPNPTTPITFSELINTGGARAVFGNNCTNCHNNNNQSGGLNLLDINSVKAKLDRITARINDAANPMPQSGLLPQNERDMVQSWIAGGTPP